MSSVGEIDVENGLRVLTVHMDAVGETLEEALRHVPEAVREQVRVRYEEKTSQPIRLGRVIADGGQQSWAADWDAKDGYYWRRLRAYLLDTLGRDPQAVASIDDSSDLVLSHLSDPRPSGPRTFRTQGLVLGHVQSGKTANFSALIAKAADLGYKLVVVLSGLHNGLRQQTQRRLERELGLSEHGVGLPDPGRRWNTLTRDDLNGDFHPGTSDPNVLQGNSQVILVVKKWPAVLRRLIGWMADRVPPELPVLIIDDEADQASINTGGNRAPLHERFDLVDDDLSASSMESEADPSTINKLIRDLILKFGRVSYVGYTATPFANVLIDHEAQDREVMEDLYPRDFIVALPRPNGYVGTERLFGRDALPGLGGEAADGLDVVRSIPSTDLAALLPESREETDDFVPRIPETLHAAILDFLLATAARQVREGRVQASTMLIHVHQRVLVQNRLGEAVRAKLTTIRQEWRYERERALSTLRARWQDFEEVTAAMEDGREIPAFDDVCAALDEFLRDPVPVLVLNSSTDDVLDYEIDPNVRAVVIGGNRLSRGLTLEGLLVSYYVRRSPYYDTLLQMGRWFGFREEYVDLTRLWTTEELYGWFRDVALREEELRLQLSRHARERLTPLQVQPLIRAHPAMLITAANKMGSARVVTQNYSGELLQTSRFRLDDLRGLQKNLDATRRFITALGVPDLPDAARPQWLGVAWATVCDFLSEYETDARSSLDADLVAEYVRKQARIGELVRWHVAVMGQRRPDGRLGHEDLGIVGAGPVATISRSQLKHDPGSIGVLTSPARVDSAPGSGDEEIGLSYEASVAARQEAQTGRRPLGEALRARRSSDEALLLVYPISRYSQPESPARRRRRCDLFRRPDVHGSTVAGIAIAFPESASPATVQWIAGSIGSGELDGR